MKTLLETLEFPADLPAVLGKNSASCEFCQGFKFSRNTFVGNFFLRILESTGNVQISGGNILSVLEEFSPARTLLRTNRRKLIFFYFFIKNNDKN